MNWLVLMLAGGFEVAWAVALKCSDGFRNPLAALVHEINADWIKVQKLPVLKCQARGWLI